MRPTDPDARRRRLVIAAVWAGAGAAVIGALVMLNRSAGLDAAANGVLATSSGANDIVTQARLEQIFAAQRLAGRIGAALETGALLAVLAAVTVTVLLVARRWRLPRLRFVPPLPTPTRIRPGTVWSIVLALGGAVMVAVGVQALLAGSTRISSTDRGVGAVVAWYLGTALIPAGLVALVSAVLGPALSGIRVGRRAGIGLGLSVVIALAWLAAARWSIALSDEVEALNGSGRQAGNALDELVGRQFVVDALMTATSLAAVLGLVLSLGVVALARRRAR